MNVDMYRSIVITWRKMSDLQLISVVDKDRWQCDYQKESTSALKKVFKRVKHLGIEVSQK